VNGVCQTAEAALKFNVAIPALAGKTITGARLRLYVTNPSATGQFQVFDLLRSWNESSTTWTQWTSGSPWTLAGANGSGDRGLVRGSFSNVSTTGYKEFPLNADGVKLVQAWLATTTPNNGLLIRPTTSSPCTNAADDLGFSSRETSNPPQLVLDYADSSAATTLKVMAYNVHKGRGTDGVYDVSRHARWINTIGSELVCMSEALGVVETNMQGAVNAATSRTWNKVSNYGLVTNNQQILTPYQIVRWDNLVYSSYACEKRGALHAEIRVNASLTVHMFCTHWDVTYSGCTSSASIRQAQSNQLKQWAATFTGGPRIILGDLNSSYNTAEVTSLASSTNGSYTNLWSKAVTEGKATAYPDNPVSHSTRTISFDADHIFFFPNGKSFTLTSATVPDMRVPNTATSVVDKIGTTDDKGVRPSDHNLKAVVITY
jgi:endonuclease/exonuclease/phosphatase family metal-dependent hydrolase